MTRSYSYRWNPLHAAASRGHINVALLLKEAGADLSAEDDAGNTPWMLAESNGFMDLAAQLKVEQSV